MKNVEKKMSVLHKRGYEIRFPGGKGVRGGNSHASFGVVIRKGFLGKIEVLVLPYKNTENYLKLKRKTVFDEIPEQTLVRKIQEETGILIDKGEYQKLSSKKIPDSRHSRRNKFHTKNVFFITSFDDSNLRKVSSRFQPNLGIPFWVPVESLEKYIAKTHLWIFEEIKEIPAEEIPKKSFF